MTIKEQEKISKFLSLVLRHKPEEIGIVLDENGWASTSEILEKMEISILQLEEVVSLNDKKRFAFSTDLSRIRASQGHSIEVNLELKPVLPPEILFHGTAEKNIYDILEKGILKQSRSFVHLSESRDTAKEVGKRYGKPVIFKVNALEMYTTMEHSFFISENNVWLTDFVPAKFINLV